MIDLCTVETGLTEEQITSINACWNSEEGIELHHANALLTGALNPPHEYVPWIVGQGVHTDDIEGQVETSLFQYVCDNYTGDSKAAACTTTERRNAVHHGVSYAGAEADEFLQ